MMVYPGGGNTFATLTGESFDELGYATDRGADRICGAELTS